MMIAVFDTSVGLKWQFEEEAMVTCFCSSEPESLKQQCSSKN
jgi:hypothetical protein